MRDLNAVILQRSLEGKRATDKEADHVWGVVRGGVGKRGCMLAVFKDAVGRNIGADVPTRQQPGGILTSFQHAHNRARFGIALGKEQEIKRVFLRHGQQVSLHETAGVPGGGGHVMPARILAHLLRGLHYAHSSVMPEKALKPMKMVSTHARAPMMSNHLGYL